MVKSEWMERNNSCNLLIHGYDGTIVFVRKKSSEIVFIKLENR